MFRWKLIGFSLRYCNLIELIISPANFHPHMPLRVAFHNRNMSFWMIKWQQASCQRRKGSRWQESSHTHTIRRTATELPYYQLINQEFWVPRERTATMKAERVAGRPALGPPRQLRFWTWMTTCWPLKLTHFWSSKVARTRDSSAFWASDGALPSEWLIRFHE